MSTASLRTLVKF